jgi:hypothetical protein
MQIKITKHPHERLSETYWVELIDSESPWIDVIAVRGNLKDAIKAKQSFLRGKK